MKPLQSAIVAVGLVLLASTAQAQARLVIQNQSQRDMTVKVVRSAADSDSLQETTSVIPFGTRTVYFQETGTYFLKTMAELIGRDPIYQKGEKFVVYVGRDGYSVLTITFSITETASPQVLGGKTISRQEFDRDSPVR